MGRYIVLVCSALFDTTVLDKENCDHCNLECLSQQSHNLLICNIQCSSLKLAENLANV